MTLTIAIGNQKDQVGSEVTVAAVVSGSDGGQGFAYQATGLPPGLNMDPETGVIRGVPANPGKNYVTVRAVDKADTSNVGQKQFHWVVFKSETDLENIVDQTHYVGERIELHVQASGGPLHFSTSGLPPGLSIAGIDETTAVISGTVNDPVSQQTVTITVTDPSSGENLDQKDFLWTILQAEVILDTIAAQKSFEGEDVYLTVRSHSSNVSYSATGLPSGLSIDPQSGVISGTATKTGEYQVKVKATDKQDRQLTDQKPFSWSIQEAMDVSGKWFKVETPDYDNTSEVKRSYLRMGAPDTRYEESFLDGGKQNARPGWVEYTDGHRFIETKGEALTRTHGEVVTQNDDDVFEFNRGLTFELGFGLKFESFTGFATDIFLGGKYEASVTPLPSVTMNTGFEVSYGAIGKYEANQDQDITLCGDFVQEATKSIQLSIDPDDSPWETWHELWAPIAASIGASVAGVAGGFGAVSGGVGWNDGGKIGAITAQGISGVLYAAGVINAIVDIYRRTRPSQVDNPDSKITMDKDTILLKCGEAGILIADNMIHLYGNSVYVAPSCQYGVKIDKTGINVESGDVNVANGLVKAKGNVETQSGSLISASFSSEPVGPTIPAEIARKKADLIKKLKKQGAVKIMV